MSGNYSRLPPPKRTPEEEFKERQKLLECIQGDDLISGPIEEIPKLVGDVIPKVGLGFLVGSSDTGKSMILTQLAIAVSTGQSFIGWETKPKHKRAIYVSTEDCAEDIKYRMHRMNRDLGLKELKGFRLVTDWENLMQKLDAMCAHEPVDLIVIDAFGDVFDGKDLNANNQVRQVLQPYNMLAQKYQCCVLFMHHTNKQAETYQPSKANLIGSQGIEGKARFIFEIRTDKDDYNLKHLCIVKANGLPASYKNDSFVLHFGENFIFSNTGKRVPFADLKIPKDYKKGNKLTPEKAQSDAYKHFLSEVFITTPTIKNKALNTLVCAKLGGSEKPNRMLITLWESMGYIRNIGTPNSIIWELGNIEDVIPVQAPEPVNLTPLVFELPLEIADNEMPF